MSSDITNPKESNEDVRLDNTLRPLSFSEYIGQNKSKII